MSFKILYDVDFKNKFSIKKLILYFVMFALYFIKKNAIIISLSYY